jgi:hypothetical protein
LFLDAKSAGDTPESSASEGEPSREPVPHSASIATPAQVEDDQAEPED